MLDNLKGLKKRFKLNMTVTRGNLFGYMYEHGYDRVSVVKERVSYLLNTEETLDGRPNFMEKNDLTKGAIEQYEVIYREEYYNGEEYVIVLLGEPPCDRSGDCYIIKLKSETQESHNTARIKIDMNAVESWTTTNIMNNMFANCRIIDMSELWTTTNNDSTRND